MKLRVFDPKGIDAVHALLDAMAAGDATDVPDSLLQDSSLSQDAAIDLGSVPKSFTTRFELALWLNRSMGRFLESDQADQVGAWTWLAMAMLDVIAPKSSDGRRKLGERARYVLEPDNWNRYYRHLLAAPCRVMRAHFDELQITRAILAGAPNSPGDVYEQVASRQEVVTSPPLVRLTKILYWDGAAATLKRGAGGKGPGSARRLAAILRQLELTWDLVEVPDEALTSLLPKREFSRFLSS
jgi:hypothetical protein